MLSRLEYICNMINASIGRIALWLSVIMVLVQFSVVVLRYVFGIGAIQLQEAVIYMHALLFMMGAAETLRNDEHVRVDIFYANAAPVRQAYIDFAGAVFFIIPFALLLLYVSYDYVALAWRVQEGSRETSGIQAIYLLKSVILLFALQLILQAIAMMSAKGRFILKARYEAGA